MSKLIDHRFEVHIPSPDVPDPHRMPTVEAVDKRMLELDEKLCSALLSFIQKPISKLTYRQRVALAYILDSMP